MSAVVASAVVWGKGVRANMTLTVAACAAVALIGRALPAAALDTAGSDASHAWMSRAIVAEQATAADDSAREAIARHRARLLIRAMSLPQKMQQLAGSPPEILAELPRCFGARHVRGIAALEIPTLRITNGPVGLGQNDCIASNIYDEIVLRDSSPTALYVAYTHPTSAQATALPAAIGIAASFDPSVAAASGEVIATEMNHLGLHVFEAPGLNIARLPILGRNFEYFGEDPYLSGTMAVAETKAIQRRGLIAMLKHYIGNEQETNRQTIQETIDRQVLRELYLLPFEMAIKDGKAAAVMCAYNFVNGQSSCDNREMLTDVLRNDWGFTGYVQSDFFAMKSTVGTLRAGTDQEMPRPTYWAPEKLAAAIERGELHDADIDVALERRYTQMFKAGIFDRALVQTPIDFALGGRQAREIGGQSAVLLQNNGALPLRRDLSSIVLMGKGSQPYAQQAVAGGAVTGKPMGSGGGSSDVVPHYTVTPLEGLRNALTKLGYQHCTVTLILVDDQNTAASIDGTPRSFADALLAAAHADAVLVMAGTIAEEGADRATFTDLSGTVLAASAVEGSGLDWYVEKPNQIVTAAGSKGNPRKDSHTTAMIRAVMGAHSTTARPMSRKTVLVLKDNAGVAMDPALVGTQGPAILETWFPGEEDGNIVADLLFGRKNPSGKLPVTFPYAGRGFLDALVPAQFPGLPSADSKSQTISYSEQLHIGYRWYDGNISGQCVPVRGRNPCVAFPFGHGLSYTSFTIGKPQLSYDARHQIYHVTAQVANVGRLSGAEVIQVYLSLPASASELGVRQPPKRLVGFQKLKLAPGASASVAVAINPASSHHPLGLWDERARHWTIAPGQYTAWIGRSSSPLDLLRAGTFTR
jgi:beta-glucosidase